MAITIRPATAEDIFSIVLITATSFQNSPSHVATYPERHRIKPGIEDRIEHMTRRIKGLIGVPRVKLIVAAEEDAGLAEDVIVGCAEWIAPLSKPAEDSAKTVESSEVKAREAKTQTTGLPPFIDADAVAAMREEINILLERCEPLFEGRDRNDMWSE